MMQKIFFSADHHFGHENILKYCNRPFSSVEEMDEVFISNWNKVIKDSYTVYYLGDFTMGGYKRFVEYYSRLNGNILFVCGNHDNWFKYLQKDKALPPIVELYVEKELFVLSHYPMREWKNSYHNSIHLHGHCHGNITEELKNSFDVGVDCWNYFPVSIEEILEKQQHE